MKNLSRLAPLLLLLACAQPSKKSLYEVFTAINGEVLANSKAYSTLEEATSTIGHRLTGSENGRKAEELAHLLFSEYGFENVQYFPFEVNAWMRDTVHLRVIGKESRFEPAVVSLAHSPVSVDLNAEIIDVQNGLRADFEAVATEIEGSIALINIGIHPKDSTLVNLHRSEKTALAIEYRAAGVIIINKVEGGVLLTGTASVTGDLISIPAVCIGLEDGLKIRQILQEGSQFAQLHLRNKSMLIRSRNVIATIQGNSLPDEQIIIGGHLDSWDLATGAIDNGLGSFEILDIARTFQALGLQPKRTVKFVMFMGEEQGLVGSHALVDKMVEEGSADKVKCMINLDMSGNTNGFNAGGRDGMKAFIDSIGQIIQNVDTSFQNKNSNRAGLHSDHQPFMMEGIPIAGSVGSLGSQVYKYYHSNRDDFNLVNKDHMERSVRFMGMLLYALADMDKIPANRFNSEETKQFLIDNKLKEKLVLGKEWRWEN